MTPTLTLSLTCGWRSSGKTPHRKSSRAMRCLRLAPCPLMPDQTRSWFGFGFGFGFG